MDELWYVALRMKGEKTSRLLGSDGYVTRRKIHAIQYWTLENAERQCTLIRQEMPEWLESCEPRRAR